MPSRLSQDLRAVTLDIGGTLIAPWPSVGHIYADVAARHGFPGIDPARLNRRFAAAWRAMPDFRHTRAQWSALVAATFEGLSPAVPTQIFFSELYDRFTEPAAWHIFPDVVPALDFLERRGLKLGIISNWDDRLRPLLRGLRLYERFDSIVISCEAGVTKPAAAIFARAARELGLPLGSMLHVGDSLEDDVRGALAAGCRALLLHREASVPGAIRSLAELGNEE